MKNKWLLISSISTALGIIAGAVYLFFAEHSLLLSNDSWALSAFWSAFVLWVFVLMFIVALVFNVLAFLELDKQHGLFRLTLVSGASLLLPDKQQQFLHDARTYVQRQGRFTADKTGDYLRLQGVQEKLVYIEQQARQVDISLIRALFQQMLAAELTAGVVVSYCGFSNQAWIFAREANIELIDAKVLKKQLKHEKLQNLAAVH